MAELMIGGRIWIENRKGHVIGPGRMELLHAVQATGSVVAAAKEMKMSYRHALEMINSMNRVSDKPLVEKVKGGHKGGGSQLTGEGIRLLKVYDKLNKSFEKFKTRFTI